MSSWLIIFSSCLLLATARIYDGNRGEDDNENYADNYEISDEDRNRNENGPVETQNVNVTEDDSLPIFTKKSGKGRSLADQAVRMRRELGLAYDDEWMSRPELMKRNEFIPVKREAGDIESNKVYNLPRQAETGEYYNFYGVYSNHQSKAFSINLKASNGHNLLHLTFRPSTILVMNAALPWWGTEIRNPYPEFQHGKEFKITVLIDDDCYKIFFNDELMSKSFPFRKPASEVSYVVIYTGDDKVRFTKIKMPDDQHPLYKNRAGFLEKINTLKGKVKEDVEGKSLKDVKEYANERSGSIAIFALELLTRISDEGEVLDVNNENIAWVLNNKEALEMLMTSGDILNNNWKKAIEILAEIIKQDSGAKSGLKLRLAVATALTFAYPVRSQAFWNKLIDGIERYHKFVQWGEEKIFFTPFYEGTAWHLRYIVGSWQTNEELVWARENILADYKTEDKVADVTHKMVAYKLYNDKGISIHSISAYYDHKDMTLAIIHEYGAACGGISRFGVGMAQAHGVPALLVGQPGHCAYIWYKNKKWTLGNDISGWSQSTTHSHIQYTWKQQAPFFQVMERAQMNLDNYRLSEKLRLVSKLAKPEHQFTLLEAASTLCPHNYDVWMELESAIEQPKLPHCVVHEALIKTLLDYRQKLKEKKNLALDKKVTTDCSPDSASIILTAGSSWVCTQTEVTFVVDLEGPKEITELKLHWWGQSKASKYDVFAAGKDGTYVKVKSEADETIEGWFNHWSTIPGWNSTTYKIKFSMRDGKKDYWGYNAYFGIRQLIITGYDLEEISNVGLKKDVSSANKDTSNINDGDKSTTWIGSKFYLDLTQLTIIRSIYFDYEGDSPTGHIDYGTKPNLIQRNFSSGKKVSVNGVGCEFEVVFDKPVKIKEVIVEGVLYPAKDILKMRVEESYSDIDYVKKDLVGAIEDYELDD